MKNFALSIRFAWETENFYFCLHSIAQFYKNHEGNPDTPAYHHFSDPPPLHNHTFYPSRDSIESCQSGTADKNVDVHKDICVHRSILCQLLLHNRAVIRQAATFPAFFGYNFLLIIVALGLIYLIWRFKGHLGGRTPLRNHPSPTESMYFAKSIGMLSRDVVMLILVIGFATALRLGDKWLKLDRRRQDLVNMQREEELKNLKSQLNPHFLFNTLNSIYALIAISPTKAQEAVHELSRLLRYVLYDTSATVSLKQELAFIDNYVSLMKLRLSSAIKTQRDT